MFLSAFAEAEFLRCMQGVSFSAPSQVYCGLFTSSPGDGGTSGSEITYTGYQRMPITFAAPAVEGQGIGIRNDQQITFPQSPINAGTVRFIGIFDAITGGNMYLYGELTEDLPITINDAPVLLLNEVLFFGLGDLSTIFKRRLFNVIRGVTLNGFTPHVALFNGHPEDGGSELAGSNYKRVPVTFSSPLKDGAAATVVRNTQRVDFPRPQQNWGTWTFTAIYDSLTGGEPVWLQQRPTAKILNKGIMPFVEEGAITAGIS